MPRWLDRLAARVAYMHARRVYRNFLSTLRSPERVQARALRASLRLVADSAFGRSHGLGRVRTVADLRRAVPLQTYEDMRPWIDRVAAGELEALFRPSVDLRMFATSSGTTARPKLVPVTGQFVNAYRQGWNTFGLKMLTDHPRAILRAILQSTSRHDASRTAGGIPCGAITGLLAQTQKRIVRRYYVGRPEIAQITEPTERQYALMRFAVERDVAFAVTANPATLIQLARLVDEQSERLIRDVHDGTLSSHVSIDGTLRRALEASLNPNPTRAGALAQLRAERGRLAPRDYWDLAFLACWTGGSMGHYLERLRGWYGHLPVRDIGLLASEGRVSIPLADGTPAGVLDTRGALFEFIPAERFDATEPPTLLAHELVTGHDYAVVLSNSTGLVRYRLDDVVRVRDWVERTPVVEFLYRGGRVSSLAGEKLTEQQVVAAARETCQRLDLTEFDFLLSPCWGDPPYYRLNASVDHPELASVFDACLQSQNEEYQSRRKSKRMGHLEARWTSARSFVEMDQRLMRSRGSSAEQYKRSCLLTSADGDDAVLFP